MLLLLEDEEAREVVAPARLFTADEAGVALNASQVRRMRRLERFSEVMSAGVSLGGGGGGRVAVAVARDEAGTRGKGEAATGPRTRGSA